MTARRLYAGLVASLLSHLDARGRAELWAAVESEWLLQYRAAHRWAPAASGKQAFIHFARQVLAASEREE